MRKNIATEILNVNELWENADKITIAENVEYFLCKKFPECKAYKVKMEKLEEITGSQKDTIYAWINRSRGRVKVPLLKLCKIASYLNVDIREMFIQRPNVGISISSLGKDKTITEEMLKDIQYSPFEELE